MLLVARTLLLMNGRVVKCPLSTSRFNSSWSEDLLTKL
jgi:hypothetical protein